MNTPEIRSREDFIRILESTIAEIDGLVAREPAYPVWGLLQRQLHAMRAWTANGADPTPEQRGRVSIGLVAARELEPAPDATMEDLITRLHLLSYYWRHWPSATAVASPKAPPVIAGRPAVSDPNQTKTRRQFRYPSWPVVACIISSVAMFTVACCLPALEFRNSDKPNDIMFGLRALAVGWSGIFAGVFAWYANPCWMLGLLLAFFRRSLLATAAGIFAILLAATTFSVIGRELPGDEGNVTRTAVIRLLPGCYLWMGSIIVLPVAALVPDRK